MKSTRSELDQKIESLGSANSRLTGLESDLVKLQNELQETRQEDQRVIRYMRRGRSNIYILDSKRIKS